MFTKSHVVTGGYDKIIRLYDISAGRLVKTFTGHQLSVSKTIFNPLGNLIISGYVLPMILTLLIDKFDCL